MEIFSTFRVIFKSVKSSELALITFLGLKSNRKEDEAEEGAASR